MNPKDTGPVIIFGVPCVPSAGLPKESGGVLSDHWAARQRSEGAGPPYYRLGARIYYPLKELREYLAKRLVTPLSEPVKPIPKLPPKRVPTAVVRTGKAGRPRHVSELSDAELLDRAAKQS